MTSWHVLDFRTEVTFDKENYVKYSVTISQLCRGHNVGLLCNQNKRQVWWARGGGRTRIEPSFTKTYYVNTWVRQYFYSLVDESIANTVFAMDESNLPVFNVHKKVICIWYDFRQKQYSTTYFHTAADIQV